MECFNAPNPVESTLIEPMCQPLLLLDIDGVISLFGFDPRRPPPGRYQLVDGVPHFLSTNAAELVAELATSFELMWCSGWEEKADEVLPAVLGVPKGLAHLSFPPLGGAAARHWKLASIEAFAGSRRPLAWLDDAFDDSCHAWAAERPGPTRLVRTDPPVGLTVEHVADLVTWRAQLSGADAR
jgi:HAD domain in Swiss Army Knife RNA repair proteins